MAAACACRLPKQLSVAAIIRAAPVENNCADGKTIMRSRIFSGRGEPGAGGDQLKLTVACPLAERPASRS